MDSQQKLFSRADLSDYLAARVEAAKRAIRSVPAKELVASGPVVADRIIREYTIDTITIDTDKIWLRGPKETKIRVPADFGGDSVTVDAVSVEVHVPFDGQGDVLEHRASERFATGFDAPSWLGDDDIVLDIVDRAFIGDALREKIEYQVERLRKRIGFVNNDLRAWQRLLGDLVRDEVNRRVETVRNAEAAITRIGYEVRD